jgi:hypothetical protein
MKPKGQEFNEVHARDKNTTFVLNPQNKIL